MKFYKTALIAQLALGAASANPFEAIAAAKEKAAAHVKADIAAAHVKAELATAHVKAELAAKLEHAAAHIKAEHAATVKAAIAAATPCHQIHEISSKSIQDVPAVGGYYTISEDGHQYTID